MVLVTGSFSKPAGLPLSNQYELAGQTLIDTARGPSQLNDLPQLFGDQFASYRSM
jgi:hypothetical protein